MIFNFFLWVLAYVYDLLRYVLCKGNNKLYEIKISTVYDWEKLGRKGSNINEFFEIISSF